MPFLFWILVFTSSMVSEGSTARVKVSLGFELPILTKICMLKRLCVSVERVQEKAISKRYNIGINMTDLSAFALLKEVPTLPPF